MTNLTRRALCAGLPAIAGTTAIAAAVALPVAHGSAWAGTSDATDPILDLYRRWLEARRDWHELAKINRDETKQMDAIMDEWLRLTDEIGVVGPSSREGMAAMLHVQWVEFGPTMARWSDIYEEECGHPENAFIAHAWRAVTGKDGWPRAEGWEPHGGA